MHSRGLSLPLSAAGRFILRHALCYIEPGGGPSRSRVPSAENGEINMKKMGTLLLLGSISVGVSLLGILLFLAVIYLDKTHFSALLRLL